MGRVRCPLHAVRCALLAVAFFSVGWPVVGELGCTSGFAGSSLHRTVYLYIYIYTCVFVRVYLYCGSRGNICETCTQQYMYIFISVL